MVFKIALQKGVYGRYRSGYSYRHTESGKYIWDRAFSKAAFRTNFIRMPTSHIVTDLFFTQGLELLSPIPLIITRSHQKRAASPKYYITKAKLLTQTPLPTAPTIFPRLRGSKANISSLQVPIPPSTQKPPILSYSLQSKTQEKAIYSPSKPATSTSNNKRHTH